MCAASFLLKYFQLRMKVFSFLCFFSISYSLIYLNFVILCDTYVKKTVFLLTLREF